PHRRDVPLGGARRVAVAGFRGCDGPIGTRPARLGRALRAARRRAPAGALHAGPVRVPLTVCCALHHNCGDIAQKRYINLPVIILQRSKIGLYSRPEERRRQHLELCAMWPYTDQETEFLAPPSQPRGELAARTLAMPA